MIDENVSVAARLNAERLMSGRAITEDEMRVIMAGLLLSVDRLTNALVNVEARLWSEARLREIVGEEFEKRCKSKGGACQEGVKSATWLGRLIRVVSGLGGAGE